MDVNVNSDLIKSLRRQRGWSQEHLAEVAGVSARTIQRVEGDGVCSMETRNALGAAFELPGIELDIGVVTQGDEQVFYKQMRRARLGFCLGLGSAGVGVSLSFANGGIDAQTLGVSFGIIGAVLGASFSLIGFCIRRFQQQRALRHR
jgi:DNA-binding XRE family transcriptional regulator